MKKTLWFTLAAILLAAAVALCICSSHYAIVGFRFYSRDAAILDLRDQEISVSHYQRLAQKLPDTRIRWNIPFQGGFLSDDTQTLSVSSLSLEDAQILAECLPRLQSVDGRNCIDLDGLLFLKLHRPEVQVRYWVRIGGSFFSSTAQQISLSDIRETEPELLRYLPCLETVTLTGGDPELLRQVRTYCQEAGIAVRLVIQDQLIPEDSAALIIHGITDREVQLLYLLPWLRALHLTEPEADGDLLVKLRQDLTGTSVTWEKTIFDHTYTQDVREVDLTEAIALGTNQVPGSKTAYQYNMEYAVQGEREAVPSSVKIRDNYPLPNKTGDTYRLIRSLEAAMEYFPEAEKLILCGSVLDNEAMAAFRQRHEGQYNVVWSVQCGKVATRTDATFFMPVKYHVYYLNNEEAYNLRYCPDMIAVDIGHMMVSDVSFVESMPNLQYLILAHTAVQDIAPLRSCKQLKFLELDHSAVQDFSPLVDCTALEDLNIGMTWNDVEPLKQVTWLKNLWMIDRQKSAPEMIEALPNTKVVCFGSATVDSGWRELPNYFAMRDTLMMYYMTW